MPKRRLNVSKLLSENKGVDFNQLKEVLLLIRELRKHGIVEHKYDIVSPFARNPIKSEESPSKDSLIAKYCE